MPDYTDILPILITMISVICIGGSSLLFLRSRDNRSRRILAGIMMTWGLFYAVRLIGMLMQNPDLNFTQIDVANVIVLISGNFYLIVLFLYPIEVIRPGWLNLKRTVLLLLPYVSITLFYYIVLFFLDEKPLALHTTDQLMMHLREFNVWYRLFMSLFPHLSSNVEPVGVGAFASGKGREDGQHAATPTIPTLTDAPVGLQLTANTAIKLLLK